MSLDVHVEGIHLTLGGTKILSDVNLAVPKGSFVTVLGPSGSGKSTTLNVLAGFLKPDAGRVRFGGRDVTHVAPGMRQLGIVFQNYAVFPHMTVAENVCFPLAAQRLKIDRRKRVAEMLELVKLTGYESRKASSLSGGQMQRVALARALAASPQVLLLDEPLSALDKQLREDMQGELKGIQREVGVTTISVTHDQSEALSMSDHVVVMDRGRVVQQGPPEEMYCRPATEFLARFLGEVNLVPLDSSGKSALLDIKEPALAGRLLVVRPEDLKLPGDGSARGFNGRIKSVQFHGGSLRLEVSAPGIDTPLIVRQIYAGLGSVPGIGQTVRLTHDFAYLHTVAKGS